jgi:hypothetical protein
VVCDNAVCIWPVMVGQRGWRLGGLILFVLAVKSKVTMMVSSASTVADHSGAMAAVVYVGGELDHANKGLASAAAAAYG